ncbi:hypothetical protein DEU56DRAFT_911338 [Suillus clintonianus]|uniref:uncharacterized protein n=1 Tax=Suillus clintonianus TaxID=1904413 RepID=UPI001B867530|nr:uncharacterized protein DEU56DRAFT_911338 [Suillus clintonianus]KAG2141234.1 hypothetical protein DEU56DRAFT_911338 [Suillus clintonianus]
MYPPQYESWFPAESQASTESQASDSQSSYTSPTFDYDQFEPYHMFSPSQWTYNPSLSLIDINSHSDTFNCDSPAPVDTPVLFSSINQTGTGTEAPEAPEAAHSDDSHMLALDIDALLKSNTPSDLLQLFSANLIKQHPRANATSLLLDQSVPPTISPPESALPPLIDLLMAGMAPTTATPTFPDASAIEGLLFEYNQVVHPEDPDVSGKIVDPGDPGNLVPEYDSSDDMDVEVDVKVEASSEEVDMTI